jgi:hypothetical protein
MYLEGTAAPRARTFALMRLLAIAGLPLAMLLAGLRGLRGCSSCHDLTKRSPIAGRSPGLGRTLIDCPPSLQGRFHVQSTSVRATH